MRKALLVMACLLVASCAYFSEEGDLRKSPCAGDPCAGNLPEITNAANV
jgi:hypothetical protein